MKGLAADFVWPQVRRTPLTRRRRHATRTVQDPPCGAVRSEWNQIRSVAVWAGTWQISSTASRTFDAMAKTRHEIEKDSAWRDVHHATRFVFLRAQSRKQVRTQVNESVIARIGRGRISAKPVWQHSPASQLWGL